MSDDLVLPDPDVEGVTVVLAGLASIQMQALAARDMGKVTEAGDALKELADENPDLVREAFLQNRDVFHVAAMPDEMLTQLDLKKEDGRLYENTEDEGWTEVEISE